MKLITVHGLYDKLSTYIQRKLSQYEKKPGQNGETKPIWDSANQMGELGRHEIRISYSFRSSAQ